MDISLGRSPQFAWPATAAIPTRWIPLSHRSLRVLLVLALYGITVYAIHAMAARSGTHADAMSMAMGTCHRHGLAPSANEGH
jgi:hypothetical protein